MHTPWRAGAPRKGSESGPEGAPPQPQAGVLSAGSGAPHGPARPRGRPKGGPTAPPARLGPARTQRSPPARPPDSVSPGSPQLPVVFLLFEQLPRLRHGRERRANSQNAAEQVPPPRARRRTECLSPPRPPARCPQGAPPLHCARVACTPKSIPRQPGPRTGTGGPVFHGL